MPEIGIEFECDSEEEAQEKLDSIDDEEDVTSAEVTEDGNFYREAEVGRKIYNYLMKKAEQDDDAEISKVTL